MFSNTLEGRMKRIEYVERELRKKPKSEWQDKFDFVTELSKKFRGAIKRSTIDSYIQELVGWGLIEDDGCRIRWAGEKECRKQ